MSQQREFLAAAAILGLRPDGRDQCQLRPVQVNLMDQFGQAEVCIGASRAICTVEGEITKPFVDRPADGFLQFNVDFGFLVLPQDPETTKRRWADEGAHLSLLLEKLFIGSRALDKEALCITSGLQVWSIRCEVKALNDDGNLRDVCSLAALAGVLHYRRPEVVMKGDIAHVLSIDDSAPVPLSIHHHPFLVSFAYSALTNSFVVDASQAEEEIASATISVAHNQHGELCCIHKPGGIAVELEVLMTTLSVGQRRSADLSICLNKAIEIDTARREAAKKNVFKRYDAECFDVLKPSASFTASSQAKIPESFKVVMEGVLRGNRANSVQKLTEQFDFDVLPYSGPQEVCEAPYVEMGERCTSTDVAMLPAVSVPAQTLFSPPEMVAECLDVGEEVDEFAAAVKVKRRAKKGTLKKKA